MRFIASLLPNLADNLAEGVHKYKCKNCESDLEYVAAKDNILTFECVGCKKNNGKVFDKNSIK